MFSISKFTFVNPSPSQMGRISLRLRSSVCGKSCRRDYLDRFRKPDEREKRKESASGRDRRKAPSRYISARLCRASHFSSASERGPPCGRARPCRRTALDNRSWARVARYTLTCPRRIYTRHWPSFDVTVILESIFEPACKKELNRVVFRRGDRVKFKNELTRPNFPQYMHRYIETWITPSCRNVIKTENSNKKKQNIKH